MKIFGINVNQQVLNYLNDNFEEVVSMEVANKKMYDAFGIIHFFENVEDLQVLKGYIATPHNISNRAEYGDFQTNLELAYQVCSYLTTKNISPEIIIEPTCGKGNFIIAALNYFRSVKTIIGIEIYKPYVWECKFNIIDFYLNNSIGNKPDISIVHSSIFDFDFKNFSEENNTKEILVVGNPPWVTNSKLGSLDSSNLPRKTNFKKHSGLDAITGKSNFDIAESITLLMIKTFQYQKGNIALLVKNTVIKNIVFEQFAQKYKIANIEKHLINSKKEFNVSVEASLFYCGLNWDSQFHCSEFDFYNNTNPKLVFGWSCGKFVSNIAAYAVAEQIDGKCPFEWRQGIKHDCSSIMELDKWKGGFINGLKEEIELENDLVYGLLKSSDLKNTVVDETRKFTIITQKKIGQETNYIKLKYPKTYEYLTKHQDIFYARKSSIYHNKPPFSIFGVGEYSFKPYKIAISGLYKTFHFTLVLLQDEKPIMLDDTCYMLGFDNLEFAAYTLILLNCQTAKQFLQAITFADAKRTFTKDILARIDLSKLAQLIDKAEVYKELNLINKTYKLNLSFKSWAAFVSAMQFIKNPQTNLFD